MKQNKEKSYSIVDMIKVIFPQVFFTNPKLFISTYICFALNGALIASSTIIIEYVFDSISKYYSGFVSINIPIMAVSSLFFIKLMEEIFSGLANFLGETYDPRVVGKLSNNINLKIAKLDPISFEKPEVLDYINKSYEGVKYSVNFINTLLDMILFYMPYFIFIGVYLFRLKRTLLFALVLVFIPVLLSQIIQSKVYSKLEDESVTWRRKYEYYEKSLVDRVYFKETRILRAQPYFLKLLKNSMKQMNTLKWKVDVKTTVLEFSMKLISLLGYMSILFMLFQALMKKEISVGAFAAVFASIDNMFNMMENIICGRMGYYVKNFGKIKNYLMFLDIKECEYDNYCEIDDNEKSIKFKDVTFSYPKSNVNVLENINFSINEGETIAIVGGNGAGKTTLAKLILAIYKPCLGTISHKKSNLKSSENEIKLSGVFQKYQRYKWTLKENIQISESGDLKKKEDICYLNNVSKNANIDFHSRTFPKGYDTILSTEFGGIDLSGGQWQRVAIGRGLYRNHDIIVLDEPTAAIDPLEESKIYESFSNITKGNTSVIITHRLGSVKFADKIMVLDKGKIVGVGNHEKLLKKCSLYEVMWNSQADYYKVSS